MSVDIGHVHVLVEHGGPCVPNCPHPDHKERVCEWWRWDGCKHDPADNMCQWPNCPTQENTATPGYPSVTDEPCTGEAEQNYHDELTDEPISYPSVTEKPCEKCGGTRRYTGNVGRAKNLPCPACMDHPTPESTAGLHRDEIDDEFEVGL